MQPQNPTGKPSVTSRSIAHFPAVSLEEQQNPASAPASGALPPSPPLASGRPSNPYEAITQSLKAAGFIVRPGIIDGRFCVRTINHALAKATHYAA